MLQAAINDGLLPAVGVGEQLFHSLQFTDDLLLFFDGTLRSAAVIKFILDVFALFSGLRINFAKSSFIPINLSAGLASSLSSLFNCPLQTFPICYLELPLFPRKLRRADYLPLIEKLDSRLAGWKSLSLS